MAVVEVKILNRWGTEYGAPVIPHHAWMDKRHHLQIQQSSEANVVR